MLRTRDEAEREIARGEEFGSKFLAQKQGLYPRLPTELVEGLLAPSAVLVDESKRLTGPSSGAVQTALLELDLAGPRPARRGQGQFAPRLTSRIHRPHLTRMREGNS